MKRGVNLFDKLNSMYVNNDNNNNNNNKNNNKTNTQETTGSKTDKISFEKDINNLYNSIDNGTTIRINSVRPERIFMNNNMLMDAQEHNTNGAAFITNMNGHTIGQPSDIKVSIIEFIPIQATNDQFRNKYLQEIEKYPSINFTNPNINNIKFNNFGKMVKDRAAIGLGTLDNYCSKNIDKIQGEYLLLSSLNSIKNSLRDDIANRYFLERFIIVFLFFLMSQSLHNTEGEANKLTRHMMMVCVYI